VNQLADLVRIHTEPSGTASRVYFRTAWRRRRSQHNQFLTDLA
jgi:hypothetical protein